MNACSTTNPCSTKYCLVGLQNRTDLNGVCGSIGELDSKSKRYPFKADPKHAEPKSLLVKEKNLLPLNPIPHLQNPLKIQNERDRTRAIRSTAKHSPQDFVNVFFTNHPYSDCLYVVDGRKDPLPSNPNKKYIHINPNLEIAAEENQEGDPCYPFSIQDLAEAVKTEKMPTGSILVWNILEALCQEDLDVVLSCLLVISGSKHNIYWFRDSNANPERYFDSLRQQNLRNPQTEDKLFPMPYFDNAKGKCIYFIPHKKITESFIVKLSKELREDYPLLMSYFENPTLNNFSSLTSTLRMFNILKKLSDFLQRDNSLIQNTDFVQLNESLQDFGDNFLSLNGFTKYSSTSRDPGELPYQLTCSVFKPKQA